MDDKYRHKIDGSKFIIEMNSHRFTQDLVSQISKTYPYSSFSMYNVIEFDLQQVKMIDSSSLGYLFELHNKLSAETEQQKELIVSVGSNHELKDLLHRFQVDLLLNVK